MEVVVMVLLFIATIVFVVTLGAIAGYSRPLKKRKPEKIDLDFLRKYNLKKEREVDGKDKMKVWRYASTGWMQLGLSKNSRLTAKLTERGRRLVII